MKINKFLSVSENKCSVVEIAQKTIQRRIYSYMTENETLQFINILPFVIHSYNNTYHRGVLATPQQAKSIEFQNKILSQNLKKYHSIKNVTLKPKYRVGDYVRVSLRSPFKRSYNLQNSYAKYEIYKISLKNTLHPKYFLKHINSPIKLENGYFFEKDLVLVKNDTFRGNIIKERKLKNGKKQFLFSYKGYPQSFNEWISEDQLAGI